MKVNEGEGHTTTKCLSSKKSALYPGYNSEGTYPGYPASGVVVHSQTPPLWP
jgi:hypothetical protein